MRAPGLITAVEGCAQPSDTGGTLDRCELHYAALEIETEEAIAKIEELVNRPDLKADARIRADKLLKENVDLTEWLIDFVERDAARTR